MARWPRCTPSKLPMVPTPPRGRSLLAYASWTTCMEGSGEHGGGGHPLRVPYTGGADEMSHQVIREGFGDLHLDERSGRRGAVVDQHAAVDLRRLPGVPALQQVLRLLADALDQHRHPPAHQPLPLRERDRPLRLQELAQPAALRVLRHAAREGGAGRTVLGAVGEGAEMVEAGPLDEGEEILEVLLRLAGKADDEGGAQEDVRRQLARPLQQPQVAPGVAA